jgi:hypothetical protein
LLAAQARIDVNDALEARDPRIRSQPARVVEQGSHVLWIRRRAAGSHSEIERRELAFSEFLHEQVVRLARRNAGRQDRGVRRVEADVQER